MAEQITYFKFLSHINKFLEKLKNAPIQAQPSKFLCDHDFGKERLTRILVNRKIVTRKESIKDPTNSDEKVAKYYVKYTIIRDGYEDKIKKLYNDYFGKEQLNECDGCGDAGSGALDGATSCSSVGQDTTRGDIAYDVKMGTLRRSILPTRKKNKKEPEPENILGKTVTAESMKKRRIKLTESQMNYILEKQGKINEVTAGNDCVGQYTVPFLTDKETRDRTPGFSVSDHVGDDGKVHKKRRK